MPSPTHKHTQTQTQEQTQTHTDYGEKKGHKTKKKAQKAKFPNFLKIVKKLPRKAPKKGPQTPPQNEGSGPKNHCKTQGFRPKSGPTPTRIFINFLAFQPNRPQKRPKIIKNPWFFKEIGPKTVSESYPPLGRIGDFLKNGEKGPKTAQDGPRREQDGKRPPQDGPRAKKPHFYESKWAPAAPNINLS